MNRQIDAINAFETQLQSSLRPVDPDRQFVSHLRYRLLTPPETVMEPSSPFQQLTVSILLASTIISVSLVLGLALLRLLFPNSKA